MQEYHQFHMNTISIMEGIGQTKTFFVMDIIKQSHQLL
jgi:Lrp/AsnC family transcriptional regulator, leucine-responsive regulatory protein